MAVSELKLIKRCVEFCEIEEISNIPSNTRGIYVLFKHRKKIDRATRTWNDRYDVVYIGMAGGARTGAYGRLNSHRKSKKGEWTHFSIFEVWDNITESRGGGVGRPISPYLSKRHKANRLNEQRSFKKLKRLGKKKKLQDWKNQS